MEKYKKQLYIGLSAFQSLAFTFSTQGVAVGLGYQWLSAIPPFGIASFAAPKLKARLWPCF
jgi:hypothetical protein